MTGQSFGRLTVVSRNGGGHTGARWLCRCACGNEVTAYRNNLIAGHQTSCGCFAIEKSTRHGMSKDRLYVNWVQMKGRCLNPKNHKYAQYGGRGVTVCARWLDFANFIQDMGRPPSETHTIDRIDVNGNYEPNNCQWATPTQQMNNRQVSKLITCNGATKTQAQWSYETGIPQQTIYRRLKDGMAPEKALGQRYLTSRVIS